MPVMRLERQRSPIDAIAGALDVVNKVYGLQASSAALDKAKQEQEITAASAKRTADQNTEMTDPESQTAESLRNGFKTALGSVVANSEVGKKNKSALNEFVTSLDAKDEQGKHILNANQMSAGYGPLKDILDKFGPKEISAAQAVTLMNGRNELRQDANAMRANAQYDNIIGKKYEDRLDAAKRLKDLISAAKDGTLVPSETLGNQIATDINLLQAGHTSVSGTEHSRPKTLFGKGGQLAHFLSGDPQAAITQADLGQMEKETSLLMNDIGDQQKSKFASWIKGQPGNVQPALISRFNESRNQYFPSGSAGAALEGQSSGSGVPGMNSAHAAPAPSYGADVLNYAKTHNITPEQAQAIKIQRGGK